MNIGMAEAQNVFNVLTEADVATIVEEGQNYLNGEDYASAVDHFAKALEEIVPKYGEVHDVLGKVYFCYGQALLGFARDEADVVVENMVPKEQNGADLDNIKEGEDEEEDEEEEDEAEGEENEKKDEKDEKEVSDKSTENKDEKENNKQSEDKEDLEGEDGENNVDNLQLAWEVLELARKIFLAEGDSGKDMLVETLYYLGDVSIENENFEAAIEDLKECLKLHEEIKGKTRRLADIHFKIALAYSMGNQFDEAISNLNAAATLLKDRIKTLTAEKEKTEENETEISEINELLPEIENKITDVLAYKEEQHKSVLELLKDSAAKGAGESSSSNGNAVEKAASPVKSPAKSANTVVNDISHLVRRNKRPSDDDDADATPPKKPHPPRKPTP
ncbi:protein HGV2 [Chrysoperla carnea]|uniref:protein HGV2 n=1 Tax=Chrysoperla carnea TaxID=189513 RepID=UPI001D081E53|nr:protein HGV2 [Chrysoperla carnea]